MIFWPPGDSHSLPRFRPGSNLFRLTLLLLLLVLGGCMNQENFSQRAGFAEFFSAHPRSETIPGAEDQRLLRRYRPVLWVDSSAEGPIDFYADYIASGELRGPDDQVISRQVSQSLLNEHRNSPNVVFVHTPGPAKPKPVAYGRTDRAVIEGVGPITALTWHFVFRYSGLPDGISSLQRTVLDLIGDTQDWHQLDHYTAATLVLNENQRPFALLLQQHNYQRTYLFGCDLEWPDDDRVAIVSAAGSNELYPYQRGENRQRSVPFMSEKGAHYLVTGEKAPMMSADDVTRADREVNYALEWLPPSDAFYSFEGFLGAKRLLPGREGPPGADFKTLPSLMRIETQIVLYNWSESDLEFLQRYNEMWDQLWNDHTVDMTAIPAFESLRQRFVDRVASCGQTSKSQ